MPESWILSCSFCCITELLIVLNLTEDDSWAIRKWQGREMPPWCDPAGRCCQVQKLRQQVGVVSSSVSPARQHGCNQFKPQGTALVPMLSTMHWMSVAVSRQCKADGVSSAPLCLKDTAQEILCSLSSPCWPHTDPQRDVSWNWNAAGLKELTRFLLRVLQ